MNFQAGGFGNFFGEKKWVQRGRPITSHIFLLVVIGLAVRKEKNEAEKERLFCRVECVL